jgi:hypothetical protein
MTPRCDWMAHAAGAAVIAVILAASGASAGAAARSAKAARPTTGYGVPAWVAKECRPANGGELLGRFAGPGDYFYRDSGDFCYFDRRPGVF